MIRKATPSDIPAIVDLAIESVSNNPLNVKIDREAITDTVKAAINPAHFVWVSEVDGEVVACIGAVAQKSFWFKGLQCSVMLYYTRIPGEGIKLFREFARWVKGRPGIKVAVIEAEPETDPRLIKFLHRLGFDRQGANLSFVR